MAESPPAIRSVYLMFGGCLEFAHSEYSGRIPPSFRRKRCHFSIVIMTAANHFHTMVCKGLIKWQNSQILRRPQDDKDRGRLQTTPKLFVIPRPPSPPQCHPEASEGPCIQLN